MCPKKKSVSTVNENGQKIWIEACDIAEGDELLISYLNRFQLLVGQKQRLAILFQQRGFKCQ